MVGIYFMAALRRLGIQQRKIKEKADKIREDFKRHMEYENLDNIELAEIERMKSIVSDRIGLEAFYNCYKEYLEGSNDQDKVRDYAGRIINYKILLQNRIVRDKYRRSYILYLLSEFRINIEEVGEFAIDSLGSDSVYTRNNALRVVQNSGNIELLLKAIELISSEEYYFNTRVLVDCIDNFNEEDELLDEALLKNIDRFNPRFQRLVIEHFSNNLNDSEDVRLKVLDVFSSSKDKSTLIMATRYFGRVIDERAKAYILENLTSPDWELRAMSAKILVKYKSQDTKAKLLESLKDPNYFVRYNSAFSYIDIEEEVKIYDELDNMTDVFAREITMYAMYARSMIDYKDYKDMEGEVRLQW